MLYVIGSYTLVFATFALFILAWLLGDWKNWKKYYPTILFPILLDFFCSILTYEHGLWLFEKSLFIPNHTITDFYITFLHFPPKVLIYLSLYPYKSPLFKQLAYITIWVVGNSLIEYFFVLTNITTYHNGWNFWWSVLVWSMMFPLLRLHHTKPLWAWLVSLGFTIFIIIYFDLPITKLK